MPEEKSFADRIKSTQSSLEVHQQNQRAAADSRHQEEQRKLAEKKSILGSILSRVLLPVAEEFVRLIDTASGPEFTDQDDQPTGCISCYITFDGIENRFTITTHVSVDNHGHLNVSCSTHKNFRAGEAMPRDGGAVTNDGRFNFPMTNPKTPDGTIREQYESQLNSQFTALCNKVKEGTFD